MHVNNHDAQKLNTQIFHIMYTTIKIITLDVDDCPPSLLTLSGFNALLGIRSEAITQPDYIDSFELCLGLKS